MKRWERRAIRAAVATTRCPDCNTLNLEVQDIERPSVLCRSCGHFILAFSWRGVGNGS